MDTWNCQTEVRSKVPTIKCILNKLVIFFFFFFAVSKVSEYIACRFPNIVTKSFGILFGKIALIIHTFRYLYHICLLLLSHFSHVWLCDPMDGSPPGSPVPGILQARTLEWVAISFSNACKWKVKVKSLSCVWLFATRWIAAYQAPLSMGFSRQEYWSGVPLPSPS